MVRVSLDESLMFTGGPNVAPASVEVETMTGPLFSGESDGASGKNWLKPTYTTSREPEVSTATVAPKSEGAAVVLPRLLSTTVVFHVSPRSAVLARIMLV